MSDVRPTLVTAKPGSPCLRGGSAYLAVYNAVKAAPGLLHGELDGRTADGEHCAIGWYFALPSHISLPTDFIDEVATMNDSVPAATPRQRRMMMLRWLRWKLAELKMPGFSAAARVASTTK